MADLWSRVGAEPEVRRIGRTPSWLLGLPFALVAGCQSVPLDRAGTLKSYASLEPSDGLATKSLVRVDAAEVRTARTVRLVPTVFSSAATVTPLSDKQRDLVTNAVDRSLCIGLSERFTVVKRTDPADLTVHAVVTRIEATDETAAGASKVISFVPSLLGIPVPVPRVPVGLGSLSIEAEAVDRRGDQRAAMVWARGAGAMGSSATVSAAGDAYDLAGAFGEDFGSLLVKGESPFGKMPSFPSGGKIDAALGRAPKHAACEAFGRGSGVGGMIGSRLGLPPEWTDDGATKQL